MLYKNEFIFDKSDINFKYKNNYHNNYIKNVNKKFFLRPNTLSSKINNKINENNDIVTFWERYCEHTSIHGIKYIAQKNLHWSERLTWFILVIVACIGVGHVSYLLSQRFSSSPLATVIESTIYPVSEISYPAVTICNNNRINWKNAEIAKNIYIPNADNETTELFKELLIASEILEFGSFELLRGLTNKTIKKLEHIDLKSLYEKLTYNCEDIFIGECWWRNKYFPCCQLFSVQTSEFGICYSFNSLSNDAGRQAQRNATNYPWRTANYGDWSGLRFTLNTTPSSRRPEDTQPIGFIVMVHDPEQWPNNGHFIPAGTTTSIVVKPAYSYTTSGVLRFTPQQRNCIFPEEISEKIYTLPGLKYLRSNCISDCRQYHMIRLCNCTIDFMFPIGNHTACNINGLVCLVKYDSILNYEKPPPGNKYFKSDEAGINCKCLPECNRVTYDIELAPIILANSDHDIVMLDIHFQYATMVKYRTDVMFGWLDLITSFGGIASLFLGSSLLSICEIVYYLTYGLLIYKTTKSKPAHQEIIKTNQNHIINIGHM